MSLIEIKVPDIGDFSEVAVIELLVKPGDTIKAEQSLITVESDKASMEIPSSHAGVVKELKVKLGDKVAEGSVVLLLEASGAASAAPAAPAAPVSEQKQPNPGVVASPGAINVEASPAPAAASFGGAADLECDVLVLGGREWVAVHTPGHTIDHLCLYDPNDGVMISEGTCDAQQACTFTGSWIDPTSAWSTPFLS